MADSSTKNKAQTRADPSDGAAPPRRVRCKLDTIDDVKAELARLYRSAKGGEIETQDASRLANMLSIHSRLIEGSDLEKRLSELEAATQKQGNKPWAARPH